MPCDGGVGTCAYDPCGQLACLNEHGYCSTSCQEADEEGTVPADLTPPAAPSTATQPSGPGGRGGAPLQLPSRPGRLPLPGAP
jgi:hypothetical protein